MQIVAATVDSMRGNRVGGQLWAFVYLAVRQLFELVLLFFRSGQSKVVELLALRHEVEVLRARGRRPSCADSTKKATRSRIDSSLGRGA